LNKNIIDIVLISSKTNYNLDVLREKIYKNKTSDNVFICGNTNAGKSTLINKFIKSYSNNDFEITTSILPSTTININEIKIDDELTLTDTPGFIEKDNISNFVSAKELKRIMPNSEIRPITYQINEGTTLLVDKYLRIEYVNGERNSFTFYISNDIIVSRINTMTNERGKDLQEFSLEVEPGFDVIVNGLCFIKITKKAKIKLYVLPGVGIYKRKSLI
jgi:ribosome biogenesis GTPase A